MQIEYCFMAAANDVNMSRTVVIEVNHHAQPEDDK